MRKSEEVLRQKMRSSVGKKSRKMIREKRIDALG